jgi:hypothetical protein
MKGKIAIAIQKPTKTKNHYLLKEVIADLNISEDQILKLNKVVDKVFREQDGDVPRMIKAIPLETSDPIEISFLSYALAYEMVEFSFERAIPDMLKEAMSTGANIAIEQIQKGSPEVMQESPGPVMAPVNSPADRMYG